MKNNTKIRLHLSKRLFESLTREVLAEGKGDMSGGAYTEAVKQAKGEKKEKAHHKMKEEGVKEMQTNVAEKKEGKSIKDLRAAKEKLEKRIHEMENVSEEEGVINEDASNEIMKVLQNIPEFYELLRTKAQMAPHEFDILTAGIGGFAGATAAVAKTVIKDIMKGKKSKKKPEDGGE